MTNIRKSFDLAPIEADYDIIPVNVPSEEEEPAVDFDAVRKNLHSLLVIGDEALGDLKGIAMQSQDHKVYEVLNDTLKTLAGINRDLLNIHKAELKKKAKPKEPTTTTVTNNNLFVGTTEDLRKAIKKDNE